MDGLFDYENNNLTVIILKFESVWQYDSQIPPVPSVLAIGFRLKLKYCFPTSQQFLLTLTKTMQLINS